MQNTPSPSGPTIPWMLIPVVHLLRWSRERVGAVAGQPTAGQRGSLDLGGALFLVATITLTAVLGLPPRLTVGGGIGLAVLFVVARSWVVVTEQQAA